MKTHKKKQKGGMNSTSKSRSRSRGRPRSKNTPRVKTPMGPIDQNYFQNVDEVGMNVYKNTMDIQKIIEDLNYIKIFLKIPQSRPKGNHIPQEVDG